MFQSESTLYIGLNTKELFNQNRRDTWSLSYYNGTRTHNHLVCKLKLNHLTKMTKWFRLIVSIYLYCEFECMFLSCLVHVKEWIHTLYLPERQGTSDSKVFWHLKFKWLQQDSNQQPLRSQINTQPFGQTDQIIELKCGYISLRWIWLYILVISRSRFRVNPHSIFAWMSRNSLLENVAISEV